MKRKGFCIIATLLSLLLIIFSLSGCVVQEDEDTEAKGESDKAITDDTVEIDWIMREDPQFPIRADMPFFDKLEEYTGVRVNPVAVPDDELQNRLNLAVASKNLADINQGKGDDALPFFLQYGMEGAFAPLDDLIDQNAPEILEFMKKYSESQYWSRAVDGKQYVIPTFRFRDGMDGHFMYRVDWFEDLGLEQPDNLDEMYECLKTIKEEDPAGGGTTIPFSTAYKDLDMPSYYLLFDIMYNYFVEDGEVKLGAVHPRMKDALAWLNKVYEEGLLQQEFMTLSEDQYYEGVYGNKVAVALNSTGRIKKACRNLESNFPGKGYEFFCLDPMESVSGVRRLHTEGRFKQPIAIASNSEHKDIAVKLLNYFFTDEGYKLINMGIGPDGFNAGIFKLEDNGNIIRGIDEDWQEVMEEWGCLYQQTPRFFDRQSVLLPGQDPDDVNATIKALRYLGENFARDLDIAQNTVGTAFRFTKFETDELKEAQELQGSIFTTRDEYFAKFVTGQKDLSEWDDYITKMKNMDVDRLLELYNTAYQRYLGN